MTIHRTALVADSAQIGEGVTIGPYACIEEDVVLGHGCVIGPHVCIMRGTRLGDNCRVHAGAVLGDVPQDHSFRDGQSYVAIGANCVIREGATVHRGGTRAGDVAASASPAPEPYSDLRGAPLSSAATRAAVEGGRCALSFA